MIRDHTTLITPQILRTYCFVVQNDPLFSHHPQTPSGGSRRASALRPRTATGGARVVGVEVQIHQGQAVGVGVVEQSHQEAVAVVEVHY